MDIKAYIESGIVESYVMRLTSPEETAEVESMMAAHPEIANAVTEFEIRLEQHLMDNAVTPSEKVRGQLFAVLEPEFVRGNTPPTQEAKVVSFSKPTPVWKYMAAASIALLLTSTGLNVYYYNKFSEAQSSYQTLLAQNGTLLANNNSSQTKLDVLENSMKMMKDTTMTVVAMKGKSNRATVYWSTSTKDVYVLQNEMPKAPAGKQYQLWALVDGKPVDAGMLDDCGMALCKMKNIPRAQGFAITLEKTGGSPTPDMEHLMVLGTI
ncbi:MAG: anti-sigma factor [Agriterribacter sp.]